MACPSISHINELFYFSFLSHLMCVDEKGLDISILCMDEKLSTSTCWADYGCKGHWLCPVIG
jgi:hypothetical protein